MSKIAAWLRKRWHNLTGTGSAASLSLGLLVLACTFISVAGPRQSQHILTSALQQEIGRTTAQARSVIGTASYLQLDSGEQGGLQTATLLMNQQQLQLRLASRLPLASRLAWTGLYGGYQTVRNGPVRLGTGLASPQLELLWRSTLGSNTRLVAGSMPTTARVSGQQTVFQVAVTGPTAAKFDLRVGSRVDIGFGNTLLVTGIIKPVGPKSAFWTVDPVAAAPSYNEPITAPPYWQGAAFVSTTEVARLEARLNNSPMQVTWAFPLSLHALTAPQANPLLDRLSALITVGADVSYPGSGGSFYVLNVALASGTQNTLQTFVQQEAAAAGVLDLLFTSLAVIGAVVLLLTARLLAEHRRAEFELMRARGASRLQLALLALRGGAIVSLPGAAIGIAAAVALTPGAGVTLAWWLAGLTLLAALAGPPAFAFAGWRPGAVMPGSQRPDQPVSRRAASRRLVIEAAMIVASVGGLIVLRQQGVRSAGFDPFTSAAPVLVAIPAAIVTLRCYPLVLRPLLRVAGHRPGAIAFVGLARAARTSVVTLLPAFAMVLALTVVAFSGMLRGTIRQGEVSASWQQTGADAVISNAGTEPLTAAVQRQIAAVPGVVRTASVLVSNGTTNNGTAFTVALVRPASFAALLADTPEPGIRAAALRSAGPGPVPAIGTRSAIALLGQRSRHAYLSVVDAPVTFAIRGSVRAMPVISNLSSGDVVIMSEAAVRSAARQSPNLMLATGSGMDEGRLSGLVRRDLPGWTVQYRSSVLAGLTGSPLPRGAYLAFAAGAVTAAGFSLLVLLITLVLGARSRELTLARLSAMGLLAGQGRWLIVAEAMPQLLAATIGGIACALTLASLVGPSLRLSVFTGTSSAARIQTEPLVLAAVAVGLVLLALVTLAAQGAIAARHGSARALRIGE